MKKLCSILLMFCFCFTVLGCGGQSAEQNQKAKQEIANIQAKIDFTKLCADTTKEFKNEQHYPSVYDAYFEVNQEKQEIVMNIVMRKGFLPETSIELADGMIRRFSSNAVSQYSELKVPTKNSYGSIYDYYKINVAVSPMGAENNPKDWYVNKVIPAGRHLPEGESTKSMIKLQDKYQK